MKSKYFIPIGLAAIGLYLLFKDKLPFGRKPQPIDSNGNVSGSTSSSGNRPSSSQTSSSASSSSSSSTSWADVKTYIVNTTSSPLNVRPTPSTSLAPISSYPKGSELLGKDSGVAGWTAVIEKGGSFPKVVGYVNTK